MYDHIAEAKIGLENGIIELERNLDDHTLTGAELDDQINRALVDLHAARRSLREVAEE